MLEKGYCQPLHVFITISTAPGETLILSIQLQGDFEGTEFTEAILLSTDGDTIESLNITDIGGGGYIGSFVTPSQPFQIQIIGSTNSSGNPISRISTTGVEPTDEEIGMKQSVLYITTVVFFLKLAI